MQPSGDRRMIELSHGWSQLRLSKMRIGINISTSEDGYRWCTVTLDMNGMDRWTDCICAEPAVPSEAETRSNTGTGPHGISPLVCSEEHRTTDGVIPSTNMRARRAGCLVAYASRSTFLCPAASSFINLPTHPSPATRLRALLRTLERALYASY